MDARGIISGVFHAAAGLDGPQTMAVLRALDEAGFVVMPSEPNSILVNASMVAMRAYRRLPGNKEEAQWAKHVLRYRAMIEKQRARLGLISSEEPREFLKRIVQV